MFLLLSPSSLATPLVRNVGLSGECAGHGAVSLCEDKYVHVLVTHPQGTLHPSARGKVGIAVYSIYFYFLNNVVNSCSIVVVDGLTTVLLLLRGQKVVLATTSGRIKNFKTFVYFLA